MLSSKLIAPHLPLQRSPVFISGCYRQADENRHCHINKRRYRYCIAAGIGVQPRQVIVDTEIGHQYRRERKQRKEIEDVRLLHPRHHSRMCHQSVHNDGDQ